MFHRSGCCISPSLHPLSGLSFNISRQLGTDQTASRTSIHCVQRCENLRRISSTCVFISPNGQVSHGSFNRPRTQRLLCWFLAINSSHRRFAERIELLQESSVDRTGLQPEHIRGRDCKSDIATAHLARLKQHTFIVEDCLPGAIGFLSIGIRETRFCEPR